MATLAERRRQIEASGGPGGGEWIAFKQEGETRILRFLFNDANDVETHQKFWNEETKEWEVDQGRGSWRAIFNCVEYDAGGANPRRVKWEVSEYLYNEYLSPYIEKDTPASKGVWEIKVRRPGTMDVSYIAFPVNGATEVTYPIPEANATPAPATKPATHTPKATPAPATQATPATPAPQPQPEAPQPAPVRKSKYF